MTTPENHIDQEIGSRMRIRRTTAGKTQADIAQFLEISPQQYQKYEKGSSKCSIETIYKLAEFYNASIQDFLPNSNDQTAGFEDSSAPFRTQAHANNPLKGKQDLDEAEAMAELLAVFMRIGTKTQRKRVLGLLNQTFSEGEIVRPE